MKVLDNGFVELIDHMGSDLTVVNAARISFSKRSTSLTDKDIGLINYLAKHNHWTPFAHPQVQLHIKLPIFVARQLMKSTVGVVYNEVSRRYVSGPPEFYFPVNWRQRPEESVKQGSGDGMPLSTNDEIRFDFSLIVNKAWAEYDNMLASGVAPEMARMVLPQNTYTELWMTASLSAVARVVGLRSKSEAQWEIQQYANAISQLVEPIFPHSWKALTQ